MLVTETTVLSRVSEDVVAFEVLGGVVMVVGVGGAALPFFLIVAFSLRKLVEEFRSVLLEEG